MSMLKKFVTDIKNTGDNIAAKKLKGLLIKGAEENGLDLDQLLTPAVNQKLDELIHTLIKEHGYTKLASAGLKAHGKRKY
jgi:hypothetical protein